jgi:hypothetical protein
MMLFMSGYGDLSAKRIVATRRRREKCILDGFILSCHSNFNVRPLT